MSELLDRLSGLLAQWEGERVSARVVTETDDLAAVFIGTLGGRSDEKHPAAFWPVDGATAHDLEQPGIYAHSDLLSRVDVHEGGFVIEYDQGAVTVNVRRLDSP